MEKREETVYQKKVALINEIELLFFKSYIKFVPKILVSRRAVSNSEDSQINWSGYLNQMKKTVVEN
jgi:hypothetical protein